MKQFKFLATFAIGLFMTVFFLSCNQGEEKNASEPAVTAAETPAVKPMEPAPAVKPGNFLLIKHKVANYAKWLVAYESHDSVRLANGLTNYVLGRGAGSDSNTVLVALKMADVNKAKELTASPAMKERMQKGGVLGMPSITFLETVMMDTSTNSSTTRMIVTHRVKDWDNWKKSFDSHKQTRLDAGLLDRAIGYGVGDNHTVTVVFAITDMVKAKAFGASKDLKDKMAEAGVEGPPTIFYYTVAKKY